MKITLVGNPFQNPNGTATPAPTVTIEHHDAESLQDVMEDLIIPALLALGYSKDGIVIWAHEYAEENYKEEA